MIRHEDTKFKKLFVGGIPYGTNDEALREFFLKFGAIKEAVVIRDRITQESKGYGFVTFHDKDCAEKACENTNPIIDGRRANVNFAYLGAKPKPFKGNGKNAIASQGFVYKPNTIMGSQPFPSNFTNGFSAGFPGQQFQTVPLISPVPQSPNGQIPSMQLSVQPVQLVEYNGVPTIVLGAVYDTVYYSPPPSYVPSPTLSANSVAPSFTYQTIAPPTPPLSAPSLQGQHFFPTHVELIGQPQI